MVEVSPYRHHLVDSINHFDYLHGSTFLKLATSGYINQLGMLAQRKLYIVIPNTVLDAMSINKAQRIFFRYFVGLILNYGLILK